jgi:hypothetical protein
MHPAGFEPVIPESEGPQNLAFELSTTGISGTNTYHKDFPSLTIKRMYCIYFCDFL